MDNTIIQHCSFDVWNTLFQSNSDFNQMRVATLCSVANITTEQAISCYREAKKYLDNRHKNLLSHTVDYSFRVLANFIFQRTKQVVSHLELRYYFNKYFIQHQPIIAQSTIELINLLVENGITWSIGSNTNFISGDIIQLVINNQIKYDPLFQLFSDQLDFAKPDILFFNQIVYNVNKIDSTVNNCEIIHIGDSALFDTVPAEIQIKSILIDNPNNVNQIITTYLKNHDLCRSSL